MIISYSAEIKPFIKDAIKREINEYKSTWLFKQLKGFPKCGIRYGTDGNGHGFVLINFRNKKVTAEMIKSKVAAAKIKSEKSVSYSFIDPRKLKAAKI